MSDVTFKPSLTLTLAHEGGFVNHPKDPGGATNKGVTQKVYNAYRVAKGEDPRSVRHITDAEVNDIYRRDYWDKAGCNEMPAGLDYAVFDYAVNSGVNRALKDLQRVLNEKANVFGLSGQIARDGVFGNQTLEWVNVAAGVDEVELIEAYCRRRYDFLKSLKTFGTFGKGWTRRVMGDKVDEHANEGDHGVIDYAVMMAKKDLKYPLKAAQLPTPIGAKAGEVNGKAVEADKAVSKTPEGIGAIAAGVGVSGTTVIGAADAVKAHIDDSTVGRMAAVVFGLLMLVGVALVVYTFYKKRKEESAQD